MQAARSQNLEILEFFLQNASTLGLPVNAKDGNGENALFYSARADNLKAVKLLLEYGMKIINNNYGMNILSQSLCEGRGELVNVILDHTPELSRSIVGGRDGKGRTVLHHYVELGDLDMIRKMGQYYDPEADRDAGGATLLMYACREKQPMDIVEYLVETLGADVERADSRNRCALFYAVQSSNVELTSYLVQRRQRAIDSDKTGVTPLMLAIIERNLSIVQILLDSKHGRDLVGRADHHGRTELHYCALHGSTPILDILVHYGAKIDCQDNDGVTPIMSACSEGRYSLLLALLRKGADVKLLDRKQRNVVHHCFGPKPSLTCAKMLVRHFANLNQRDESGMTPLMLACQTCAKSNIPVIRYLVERGADPVAQDNDGNDAADHCPFDAEYVKACMRESVGR